MSELHYAACQGDFEGVCRALASGLDVNGLDDSRWTPLHWVVDMGLTGGEREAIVGALIAAGADTELQDFDGRTALIVACQAGNGDLVRLLVHYGANVETKSRRGRSPLMEAAIYGLPDSVSLLLQSGADPEAEDNDGMTALDLARDRGWDAIVVLLGGGHA